MRIFFSKVCLYSVVGLFFVVPSLALADTTYNADTTLNISSLNLNLTILSGSTADSISVTSNFFNVSLDPNNTFRVRAPSGYTFTDSSGFRETCNADGTRTLTLGPSTDPIASSITVAATTEACAVATISSGAPVVGGGPAPIVTPDAGKVGEPDQGITGQQQGSQGFTDIAKLSNRDRQNVERITKAMTAKYIYRLPANNKYKPRGVTKSSFGLQMALAVAGKDCGAIDRYSGISRCATKGREENIIDKSFTLRSKLSRSDFYEMLVKASGASMVKASVKDLKQSCSDADPADLAMSKAYFTAKSLGITSRYSGRKCQLNKPFSRLEAAKFAVRALNAKARLEAEAAANAGREE